MAVVTQQERRQRFAAGGLCRACGRHPPEAGLKRCRECLDKQKLATMRYLRRRREAGLCPICGGAQGRDKKICRACAAAGREKRSQRRADGLCAGCGRPSASGYYLCYDCRAKFRDWRARSRAQEAQE